MSSKQNDRKIFAALAKKIDVKLKAIEFDKANNILRLDLSHLDLYELPLSSGS